MNCRFARNTNGLQFRKYLLISIDMFQCSFFHFTNTFVFNLQYFQISFLTKKHNKCQQHASNRTGKKSLSCGKWMQKIIVYYTLFGRVYNSIRGEVTWNPMHLKKRKLYTILHQSSKYLLLLKLYQLKAY